MSDSILVDVDLEPAKNTAAMKQKVNLQHCDSSEGKRHVTQRLAPKYLLKSCYFYVFVT